MPVNEINDDSDLLAFFILQESAMMRRGQDDNCSRKGYSA
jgi:hypothetical protein